MPLPWTEADYELKDQALSEFLQGIHDPIEVMLFAAERQVWLSHNRGVRSMRGDDPVLVRYRELNRRPERLAA